MTTSVGAKVLAEVYRLHHIPLPPITLQALLKRGPRASPAIAASLQNDPQALTKWREVNAPAIVTSAQLLHREVPIRIARRIVDLENLPDELPQAKPIVSLREQLLSSFDQLMSCPLPSNLSSEREFMELHGKIRKEHATMHGNIAEAVQALEYEPQGLSESLDNFYNSRIGIRMLVDQHVAAQTPTLGFTGIVNDECSPVKIAQDIVHKVRPLWQESLNGEQLPEIIVRGDEDATYRYVPQHIEIILTEVFKNAVLNSVAAATRTGAKAPPPVSVLISGGPHGVCVKVSDLGGGMTRSEANDLSNYYHTATSPPSNGYDPVADVLERRASGLDFSDSFGLRIAQLYAKYFGGELAIMPMEGHGVDTYIYMNCLTGASELNDRPFPLVWKCDLVDAARSDRRNWRPPGATEESEHQPLWKSKPNTTYPHELGLILLSAQPAMVKTLRLTVELVRAPAQSNLVVIFEALPPRIVNELNSLDAVSRYLSSEWERCCEPLVWEVCSSARLDTFRDTESRIVRLDISECSFLKLVVHAPHKSPSNQSHQVVLEDIELLGSFEDSVVAHKLDQSLFSVKNYDEVTNHRSGVIHRPVRLPLTSDQDELQAVMLDAGVPMDLVAQVTTICELEVNGNMSYSQSEREVRTNNTGEIAPESNAQTNQIVDFSALESQKSIDKDNKNKEPASPFDNILRQYVEQTSREWHMLEEILKISTHKDEVSSWQSPTVSPSDPTNSNEITMYTFGAFFTQCLLCGGAEIQVSCIQLVERVAPLLKKALGTIPAFEGIVALIILGAREAKSSQVFHATIHLAYTVFLTKTTKCQDDGSIDHENLSVLRLIEEIARANWSYGLRVILEWILTSPFCWSVSHTAKTTPYKTNPRRVKPSDRSSKVPPSIDRIFLQFIRLLVDQDLTRGNFFNELIDITPTVNASGIVFVRNRLRLLRLVLRNDLIRCQVSPNLKTSIQALCTTILSSQSFPQSDQVVNRDDTDTITTRLASECSTEIDRYASSGHKHTHLLASLHKHLQISNNPNSHRSYRYCHTALFIQDPLLNTEETTFMTHLQRYFSFQPRPNALYRYSFVSTNASKSDEGAETCESFQKGNISFQGHVVARMPPTETFHDKIQRNSAPFVFDIDESIMTPRVDHQKITSSFAVFRGSVERRIDLPKRSSRVSPEQKETPPTATTPSNEQSDATYVNSTMITPLSGTPALKSPVHVVKISTSTPKIATSSQKQTTSTTDQMRSTANQASYGSTHIPGTAPSAINSPILPAAVAEQILEQPQDLKSLNSSKQPDRKNDNKIASNENAKSKTKKNGKDSDDCVLQ